MLEPIEIDEIYVDGLEASKRAGKKTKGTQGRSTKVKSAAGIKSRVNKKRKLKQR